MNRLSDTVLHLVRTLPPSQRARLIEDLARCDGPVDATKDRLAAVSASPAFALHISSLIQQWSNQPDVRGSGLALALEVGGAAVDADRRRQVRPVWSGPDAGLPVRLTAGVLAEVIAGARHRLTVISFAAYKIPQVLAAIEAAANRGVHVGVVLETAEDSGGALSFDQLPEFTKLAHVDVWHWPRDKRPPEGGSLHAKALVADGEVALVTSANLTERALTHNIELGILLHDPAAASAIERHIEGLRRANVLARSAPR